MDRISSLPDDLILKILSFSSTEVAITTSLLSKRWRDVWKHVPKLEYYAPRSSTFVQNFLLLHKAPVLQTMHVRLPKGYRPTDIEILFRVAISRGVCTLYFQIQQYPFGSKEAIRLPGSLYTCQTLVTLHLIQTLIVDVPLTICFPSLKTLMLTRVDFASDETVERLLSGCHVLEDLTIIRENNGYVKTFTIMVPSLLRLTVGDLKSIYQVPGNDVGFVIKAPSLTSLEVVTRVSWVCSLVNMPSLVKANIKLPHGDSKKLIGCLTSAKHLSLCVIPPMYSYPLDVFYRLVSLELCTCCSLWAPLILGHTPKLRVLRFRRIHRCYNYIQIQWEQTSSVPQCVISSLETVEWIDYKGRELEKKVVMYLLENCGQLKKMAIKAFRSKSTNWGKRVKMLQELRSTQRSSKQCQFSFT